MYVELKIPDNPTPKKVKRVWLTKDQIKEHIEHLPEEEVQELFNHFMESSDSDQEDNPDVLEKIKRNMGCTKYDIIFRQNGGITFYGIHAYDNGIIGVTNLSGYYKTFFVNIFTGRKCHFTDIETYSDLKRRNMEDLYITDMFSTSPVGWKDYTEFRKYYDSAVELTECTYNYTPNIRSTCEGRPYIAYVCTSGILRVVECFTGRSHHIDLFTGDIINSQNIPERDDVFYGDKVAPRNEVLESIKEFLEYCNEVEDV